MFMMVPIIQFVGIYILAYTECFKYVLHSDII